MKTVTDYVNMQQNYYDTTAHIMNSTGNHRRHDGNPDYKNILLARINTNPEIFQDENGLDFGCGQGRNVSNLLNFYPGLFNRVDGIDISKKNTDYANNNLQKEFNDSSKYTFYVNDGKTLAGLKSDEYKFVMSTIVFQHIAVHEIRFSLMSDIFRVLKTGGVFSFQMGFGGVLTTDTPVASYYENAYHATGTNSAHDVEIIDPQNLVSDLEKIGFSNITYKISAPDYDRHKFWIYVEAFK